MLTGLLFVIFPLAFGYLFKTNNLAFLKKIDASCQYLVSMILMLMGLSLAKIDELGQNLTQIIKISGILFLCISLCNLIVLVALDKVQAKKTATKTTKETSLPIKSAVISASKLILTVLFGLIIGLAIEHYFVDKLNWVDTASESVLFILLIFIGITLRNSAISIKQMLLNTQGLLLAFWVMISSFIGGLLAAYFLELPLNYGLAMASGFGWYSLTGILISEHLGPILGSAAFLNELLRELIALMFIPILINRYPSTAIGYAGATAMDFTLPVIQQSGGNQYVPTAIISGFILSLFVPLFVVTFASL